MKLRELKKGKSSVWPPSWAARTTAAMSFPRARTASFGTSPSTSHSPAHLSTVSAWKWSGADGGTPRLSLRMAGLHPNNSQNVSASTSGARYVAYTRWT